MNLATVFSGIGAIEEALKKLNIEFNTVFACDNGERYLNMDKDTIIAKNPYKNSEINKFVIELYEQQKRANYVKISYKANHKLDSSRWYEDVRFIDGTRYKNKVDIFVGGSPCQSFSIIGKRAGLDDTRGTLFYDFARLVKEIQPKVFIFENVKGMLSHDKGNTWMIIRNVFESLGYHIFDKVLNSKEYGIPQDRSRLFVVGFKEETQFVFPQPIPLTKKTIDFLDLATNEKYYLGKKGFEFVTNPKYRNRAKVNLDIITTQKANQQFNWNGDFIMEPLEKISGNMKILNRAYVGDFRDIKGVIRKLTPRECLRLMGFRDDFNIVVPDKEMYRQAGNSIVVEVLMELIKQIMKVTKLDE